MSNLDFGSMSKSELKRYLLEHRNDTEAFHALMDKVNAEPNQKFYTVEEVDVLEQLIKATPHETDR